MLCLNIDNIFYFAYIHYKFQIHKIKQLYFVSAYLKEMIRFKILMYIQFCRYTKIFSILRNTFKNN